MKLLEFRWTISRGRDTYGYNICSLWVDGVKVSSCNGGGYDMEGTALALYVEGVYQDKLMSLRGDVEKHQKYYGLKFYDNKPCLDGGCGFSSITKIMEAINLKLEYKSRTKSSNRSQYLLLENN